MKKDYYSQINDYKEERDSSILLSNPEENQLFSDEQQSTNKFSLSDYNNDNFLDFSPFPYIQQFSLFPSLNTNEEEINKPTFINSPIEISKSDEKKNDEVIEKKSIDGKLSQTDKELLVKNLAEKIKENELYNEENTFTNKKRRSSRIHLEDLNIDPKLIGKKGYQIIGDKVITSKGKMTEDDKKEVKAIRNRISSQKNRNRKKAEFINLLEETKILKTKLEIKDFIIKKYKEIVCAPCKKKFEKIDEEFSEKFITFKEDNKEYLTLEENNSLLKKLNSSFGKLASVAICLVCLIGIIFCVIKSGYSYSPTFSGISKSYDVKINDKTNIRHLSSNEQKLINESKNENLPILVSRNLNDYEKYLNTMQMCNKKFVFDISSKEDKTKQKNRFLANQIYHKDSESVYLNSNIIHRNNYILEDDCEALTFEDDNTVLNDKLSCKIISMYIKDYYTLKGEIDDRNLSIKEQIELEAKNSDDGFVYVQMIFPNNKEEEKQTDFKNDDKTYTNEVKGYFEIRCKILEINNYDSKKIPIYS